jgi:uncharacterized flavoprotein (TIGR03862 family)
MANIAVIGGGPAGLMAAEVLSAQGCAVTVYDRMPSPGRKFLMAGRGGLNLTHSQPFLSHYREASDALAPMIAAFPPAALRAWADGLDAETFVGSSGRVFPKAMKASPLLRAWLVRLAAQGVVIHTRHTWRGWRDGGLAFDTPRGPVMAKPDATLLALGGASWPRLGGDGDWIGILKEKGVEIAPLRASNVGFTVGWSDVFRTQFAGQPLKNIALRFGEQSVRGEAMITHNGIEGGAIYTLSPVLRDAVIGDGLARIEIDLRPTLSEDEVTRRLEKPRGKASHANHLRKVLGLSPMEINLLRETGGCVKSVPVTLNDVQPIARAISTAGGISFRAQDDTLQLRALPGVWAAGEMLDWEAPTGGYLLQACFSTGAFAAHAILNKIGA